MGTKEWWITVSFLILPLVTMKIIESLRYADDIDEMLHILYLSTDSEEFIKNLDIFLIYWTKEWSPYAKYFENQWLNAVPPSDWAFFNRTGGTIN